MREFVLLWPIGSVKVVYGRFDGSVVQTAMHRICSLGGIFCLSLGSFAKSTHIMIVMFVLFCSSGSIIDQRLLKGLTFFDDTKDVLDSSRFNETGIDGDIALRSFQVSQRTFGSCMIVKIAFIVLFLLLSGAD